MRTEVAVPASFSRSFKYLHNLWPRSEDRLLSKYRMRHDLRRRLLLGLDRLEHVFSRQVKLRQPVMLFRHIRRTEVTEVNRTAVAEVQVPGRCSTAVPPSALIPRHHNNEISLALQGSSEQGSTFQRKPACTSTY